MMMKHIKLFKEFGDNYPKHKFVELSHRNAMNYANEIFDLIQTAYSRKGGNIEIQKPSDLKGSDITYWILKDIDQNPDADLVVGGKFTKSGVKITLIGQDGSSEAKKEVMGKVTDLMQTGGFYAEVDKELAQKLGLKYTQDESVIRKVIDKDLTYNQDGSYDRKIGNQFYTKVLVGKPRK